MWRCSISDDCSSARRLSHLNKKIGPIRREKIRSALFVREKIRSALFKYVREKIDKEKIIDKISRIKYFILLFNIGLFYWL